MNQVVSGYNGRPQSMESILGCVGKGWHPLVTELIEDCFKLGWDGQLCQIKEKFGGLRFYVGPASSEVHDRISQAEAEADRTCENCGQPGEARGGGWIKTLCDDCNKPKEK